jgi:hypothetical protein
MTGRFRWWVEKLYPWRQVTCCSVTFVVWVLLDPFIEPYRCKDGFNPPYYGGGPSAIASKCVAHGGLLTNWSGYCIGLTSFTIGLFIWLMLAEWHLQIVGKSN